MQLRVMLDVRIARHVPTGVTPMTWQTDFLYTARIESDQLDAVRLDPMVRSIDCGRKMRIIR